MFELLINSFVPVALLILIGYFSAKKSIFKYEDALSIIKYIGVIAVPVLTFKMTVSISFSNVNWLLISSYIISELIIYLAAIFISCRTIITPIPSEALDLIFFIRLYHAYVPFL